MSETINIAVERSTHSKLSKLGAKDETFDTIIRRLLALEDAYKESENGYREFVEDVVSKSSIGLEAFGKLLGALRDCFKRRE